MSNATPTVVLCIDDDPTALLARRLVLVIAGYDVLTASSGDAALRIFRRRQVDVVITDHFIPGATGVELTMSMKRMRPEVLVVLLTAALEPLPGGEVADLVLVKGMAPKDFLAAIAKLVAERRPATE